MPAWMISLAHSIIRVGQVEGAAGQVDDDLVLCLGHDGHGQEQAQSQNQRYELLH